MTFKDYKDVVCKDISERMPDILKQYGTDKDKWFELLQSTYDVTGVIDGSYYCDWNLAVAAVTPAIWEDDFLDAFERYYGDIQLSMNTFGNPEVLDVIVRKIALWCVIYDETYDFTSITDANNM